MDRDKPQNGKGFAFQLILAAAFVTWMANGGWAAGNGNARAAEQSMTYKGITLIGSRYTDINNKPFFSQMKTALDLAASLPPRAKRAVFAITRIIYDPQSKLEPKDSRPSWKRSAKAYYALGGNPERDRVVTVVRNLKYRGAPAPILTTLVHEGTHAQQDMKAALDSRELVKLHSQLTLLSGMGGMAPELITILQQRIGEMTTDLRLWKEGPGRGSGEYASRFECEAALNAVIAAKALGLGRSQVGAYASICPNVKKKWFELVDDGQPPPLDLPASNIPNGPPRRPTINIGR